MAKRTNTELAFSAIRIEGSLLAADFLGKVARFEAPGQTEADYDIPKGLKLRDEIGRYWKIALNLWQEFGQGRQRTDFDAHSYTSEEFLEPFCRYVLGFSNIQAIGKVTLEERVFPIGYQAFNGRVPLVFAAHSMALEQSDARFGDGHRRRSPFLLAQEYLNAEERCLWAIVSNGLKLRILRDNPSMTRPAYIEVDLESIFNEERYPDFTALWLLAHATRFGSHQAPRDGSASDCYLERWRNTSQEAGIRARNRLRDGVEEALRSLGTGFICHPKNAGLREQLDSGTLSIQAYYEQLLRLVYRFIFLATLEDRQDEERSIPLVFVPDTGEDVQERYLQGYSLNRLRNYAAKRRHYDRYTDLWQSLTITFSGLAQGQPALGLPALGGLFAAEQCPGLDCAQLENRFLLQAIFGLCFFREGAALTRVNYRDMDSEEFGSVYESLLELVPVLGGSPGSRHFGFVGDGEEGSTKGNARKLSGSYYTPDSLVQELIKSALEPVIAQTLRANPKEPVKALLELTVCDPACGSGHFLLAAARRIADEVARLNASDGNPSQSDYRHALRDVIAHCIYGVDKNPMAIELARTALWLEAYTPDRPLTFIDHHLRCGDALLGVLDFEVLQNGIPDEAYTALSGDDKEVASALKKQNKADLKSWKSIAAGDLFRKSALANEADAIEHLTDDSLAGVEAKRAAWREVEEHVHHSAVARLADTYVAAFLAPKLRENSPHIPLSGYLWGLINNEQNQPAVDSAASDICRKNAVFHWWLAFPQVRARGGFSVMLGNPPWERIKLQEEEFFAARSPLVATAKNKAERGQRIEWLRDGVLLHNLYPDVEAAEGLTPPNRAEIRLYQEFIGSRRGAEAASLYAHNSGRYPLTGVGDVNTYALFAESFYQLVAPNGRTGFIVPTGIATDDSTKAYFEATSQSGRLALLYSFENEEFVFPAVHHAQKFCLMVVTGEKATVNAAEFVHYARQVTYLGDPARRFMLTPDEFRLINPNTRTCPMFRSKHDADLTKKLYRAVPVLIEEGAPDKNPWAIRFSTMFHMSNDSSLFRDRPAASGESLRLPLYEAKMIHQFDHRWATYVDAPDKSGGVDTADVSELQKVDPAFVVRPRYWVDEHEVLARISRVPARVASAWLGVHTSTAGNHTDAEQKLLLAIASWVAGELFRNAVGAPENEGDWSARQRLQGAQAAESILVRTFPSFATALKAANFNGKKALAEFGNWALQDAEVGLFGAELEALSGQVGRPAELLSFLDELMNKRSPKWLLGYRRITNSTNERTCLMTMLPRVAAGDSVFLMDSSCSNVKLHAALLANLVCIPFDYVCRQKIGGLNFSFYIMKQLPVIPPERYTDGDLDFIAPRILELTYTAHDLKPWAEDLGYSGEPFQWNPDRRAVLRAELDAYYAMLYGLTRDELRYILDPADLMGEDYPSETFRVLKNNEIREFGEYRTARLVLREFDRMALADASHEPYLSLLVPSPGQSSPPQYSAIGIIRDADDARLAGLALAIIRQAGALSRQNLTLALTAAADTSGATTVLLEKAELEQLTAYLKSHQAMLLPARLERMQSMLRFFEDAGAIRIEQQGAWIAAAAEALPHDAVIVEQGTDEIAAMLLRIAGVSLERRTADDLGTAPQIAKRT